MTTMPTTFRPVLRVAALAAAPALLLATACSKSIDGKSAEAAIIQGLQGQGLDTSTATVSCPSSIPAQRGATFRCTLTESDGSSIGITATQTDDNGQFTFVTDDAATAGGSTNE
jgi:hypothetical protein